MAILQTEFKNYTLEKRHIMAKKGVSKKTETENGIVEQEESTLALASPLVICEALVQHTSVKLLKYDTTKKIYYYYEQKNGIYITLKDENIESLVNKIIRSVYKYVNHTVISNTVKNLKIHPEIAVMSFEPANRFIAFKNGILDLVTGLRLDFSPQHHILTKINVNYPFDHKGKIVESDLQNFFDFLLSLTQGNINFAIFVRCYMYAAFLPINQGKIFLIQGASMSGKSKFTEVFKYILGQDNVISTSFRLLKQSIFENDNLRGKKMLLINDTTIDSESLKMLKALSSNDSIPGRRKNEQKATEFVYKGVIIVVTNDSVNITDDSGALQRRLIQLTVRKSIAQSERLELFETNNTVPTGILVKEIPMIIKWIFTTNYAMMRDFLHNTEYINSYSNIVISDDFHILYEFILKYYDRNPKGIVYINYHKSEPRPGVWLNFLKFVAMRKYDTELSSIASIAYFTESLVSACRSLNYNDVMKDRDAKGIFIRGLYELQPPLSDEESSKKAQTILNIELGESPIQINNPNVTDRQLLLLHTEDQVGSSLPHDIQVSLAQADDLQIYNGQYDNSENILLTHLVVKPFIPSLGEKLAGALPDIDNFSETYNYKPTEAYCSLYYITPIRKELNDFAKKNIVIDLHHVLTLHLADKSMSITDESKLLIEHRLRKLIHIINENGVFVSGYSKSEKEDSISPRLFPKDYKNTFHMATRILRKYCLEQLAMHLKKNHNMTVIDMDLKTCFFSIVTGLFPITLSRLFELIDPSSQLSLWQALELEFNTINSKLKFEKKLAKKCVYATLFGAAKQGLIDACIKEDQEFFGLSPSEHKKMPHYLKFEQTCIETVETFVNTDIYKFFLKVKEIAKFQAKNHNGKLMGPNNNYYDLLNDYHSAWPCFIQDYEFNIISNIMLKLKATFPSIVPLMHLHDGVHFVCNASEVDMIQIEAKLLVKNCSKQLLLGHNLLDIEFVDMGHSDNINTIDKLPLNTNTNSNSNITPAYKKPRGRPSKKKNVDNNNLAITLPNDTLQKKKRGRPPKNKV